MSKIVIDCSDALQTNIEKLAAAAVAFGQATNRTPEQVLAYVIGDLVGHDFVDEQLEENMVAGLAKSLSCDVTGIEDPFNKEAFGVDSEE